MWQPIVGDLEGLGQDLLGTVEVGRRIRPCSIRDAQIQSGPGWLFSAPGTSSRCKRRLHPIDYEDWRIQPSSPDPWRRADTRRQGHTRTGQTGKVMFLSSVQLLVQWQQRHPTRRVPARPA